MAIRPRAESFPCEEMVIRFLAGETHFSRHKPRITAYNVQALAAIGFHVVKQWEQKRWAHVYRPDDMAKWQARYDEITGGVPLMEKKPIGRPAAEKEKERRSHTFDKELFPLMEAEALREGYVMKRSGKANVSAWLNELLRKRLGAD